jgi:hypothetical protein
VISRFGLPAAPLAIDYDGFRDKIVNQFIEIQLWSDRPVREHVGSATDS